MSDYWDFKVLVTDTERKDWMFAAGTLCDSGVYFWTTFNSSSNEFLQFDNWDAFVKFMQDMRNRVNDDVTTWSVIGINDTDPKITFVRVPNDEQNAGGAEAK
jgi:hypothetical protein